VNAFTSPSSNRVSSTPVASSAQNFPALDFTRNSALLLLYFNNYYVNGRYHDYYIIIPWNRILLGSKGTGWRSSPVGFLFVVPGALTLRGNGQSVKLASHLHLGPR
jgi:hypothetical protein